MSLLLNSTTAKTNWDLDPRSIPDCQIWFDAADTSTLGLDGSTVKTWRNKGSLNMNAIQDTGTCTSGNTVNGLNYITCPAGAHLSFTCALTAQARSVFVVARNTTQLTGSNFWGPINQTAGAGQMAVVVSRTSALVITFPTDMGPSGFGANGISAGANGPNPFGQVNVYAFVQSSTATANNALTINGTPSMSTSNIAANYNINSVKYVINTAGYNTGSDICEILYYSREVSGIERRAIEGYLMWKWGLKRQNEVGFIPTSIANCALWYDADVDFTNATSRATSFTFSSTSPVGTVDSVQVWKDKSGNARDATFLSVAGSTARPILTANRVNGKCAVIFNGANALNNTYSLPTTQAHTLFVVAAPNQNGFRAVVSLNSYPGLRGNMLVVYQSNANIWRYSGATAGTDGYSTALAAAANRYDILSNYWSPSSTQINLNGHFVQTSAVAPASLRATSTMLIGAVPGSSTAPATNSTLTEFWSGGIAEIILYTATLTIDQRNQVERYLSLKWNRPLVNACALGHPNKWVPTFAQRFNPTDVTGCTLWLDAADFLSVSTSGGSVSQWSDKSGNGRHATQVNSGSRPTHSTSSNAIVFNGASYLDMADAFNMLSSVGRHYTAFVVEKRGSASVGFPINGGTAGQCLIMGYNSNTIWRHTTASVGDLDYTVPGWANPDPIRIWSGGYNGVTRNTYINGTLGASQSFTTALTGWTSPMIGYLTLSNLNIYYRGEIYEIIFFNSLLSSGDRQKVEGYLAEKWGLRASLPNSHPAYYPPAAIDVVKFVPTSITGCRLWLDASDTSTINGGAGIAAGGEVATWGDKSGNSIMVGNLGGTQCTWNYSLNKLPAVLMNKPFIGGFGSGSLTNFQHTAYIVTSLNSYPTAGYPCFQMATNGTTSPTNALNALDYSTTFRSTIITGGTSYPVTLAATALSTPLLWRSSYDGINSLSIKRNSDSGQYGNALLGSGMPTTNATAFYIGGRYNNSVATWPGHISEIIVYNSILSPANATLVETYLARKWGLTQVIPAANRFTNPATIPSSPRLYPTTFDGLVLWLDATDPYGSGRLPADGQSIRQWVDKSGNSYTVSQNAALAVPVFRESLATNGLPGLDFTSSAGLLSQTSFAKSLNVTMLLVGMVKSTIGNWGTFWGHFPNGDHDNNAIQLRNTASQTVINWHTNNNNTTSQLTYTLNSMVLYSCTMTSGNVMFMQQTTTAGTNSVTVTNGAVTINTASAPIWVGRSDSAEAINSYIYEIVYYQRVLTTTERQQLEGYLAWKWGLYASLPPSHPYSKFSP